MILGPGSMGFVKETIVSPGTFFEKIGEGRLAYQTVAIFGIAATVTFLKAFLRASSSSARQQDFFPDSLLNSILSLLGNPLLSWLFSYFMYFAFLWCVHRMSTSVFASKVEIRALFIAAMALSGIGVAMHIVAHISSFLLPAYILVVAAYGCYFWILFLTIKAVHVLSGLSIQNATVSVLTPFVPIFFIGGMPALAPYLSWLVPHAR